VQRSKDGEILDARSKKFKILTPCPSQRG
jgi:hypothetical protein